MAKYVFFHIVSLIICIETIYSQSNYSSRATQVQLEALGPGSLFSINIDSRFGKKENGIGYRIGIGGTPLGLLGQSCNSGVQISIPADINYLIGNKQHFLELGAGGVLPIVGGTKVYCADMDNDFFNDEIMPYGFVSAGYRYQPFQKKGFTYRIFVSPLFQKGFAPKFWGGFSAGYRW